MKIIDRTCGQIDKSEKILQITDDNFVIETGVFDDGDTCHLCMSCQVCAKFNIWRNKKIIELLNFLEYDDKVKISTYNGIENG